MKKDRSGFVNICDTICEYCRKEVKLAHGIEEVYMYFNGSGIWGGETMSIHTVLRFSVLCYHIPFARLEITALNIYLIMFYSRCNKPSFTILLRKCVIDKYM